MSLIDEPLSLRCGLRISQRIAMAPLTNTQSAANGVLGEDELRWLERRARDGFHFISTCAAFVSDEGHAWKGQLGIATDEHLPGLSRLAEALRSHGATAVVQLHHGGAKADLAPNQRLSTADGGPANTRGATAADIARVIADFVAAAQRAERAGFDGVELHGANGYLFTQFLAPADNPRIDEYGNNLEGRARFLRETLRAVRAAVAPSFAVGVRLSPVDLWAQRGLILEDGAHVASWLAEDGADFLHLSLRDAAAPPPHEPEKAPVARVIRDALPADVALFACGGIWTRADAERAFAAGVDVVVLGRASIAHPDWPFASLRHDFAPVKPPWQADYLRSVDVGSGLLNYLRGFSGMMADGSPPRD